VKPFSRLAELVEDWQYLIQRDGMKSGLLVIRLELATLPYRHLSFHVVARSLTEPLPNFQPKIALELRPFQQADVGLVREIDRPSEARLCAQRLAHGHKGLLALNQGQPVGYAWGCTEVNPALERVHLTLEPGDVLCTDVYTAPSFRGQGVQTALTLARFRMFRDLGYRRAVCYIERRNGPSLAVWQRKLRGQTVGQVDFLRLGAWYHVRLNWNHAGRGSVQQGEAP
jgi:GNAT superfamily N-acetyltransferase